MIGELKNLLEEAVSKILDDVWKDEEMCKCKKCRLDIMAMVLNEMSPRYVVTQRGEAFSKTDFLELQRNIDIMTSLSKAVKKVKASPKH